jgi:hypothetical protein
LWLAWLSGKETFSYFSGFAGVAIFIWVFLFLLYVPLWFGIIYPLGEKGFEMYSGCDNGRYHCPTLAKCRQVNPCPKQQK